MFVTCVDSSMKDCWVCERLIPGDVYDDHHGKCLARATEQQAGFEAQGYQQVGETL